MKGLRRIDILGGGPAGLYTAILLRRWMPDIHVRVTEASPRDVTWGFGVVFSDSALDFLRADDPETHDLIAPRMERWQNMTLNHPDGRVDLDGIGFAAIGRLKLLQILQDRAEALGAELRFGHTVASLDALDGDLVVGADGLNSLVRRADPAAFGETISYMDNRFAWFGTPRSFDTLTQTFRRSAHGAMNAHHYRYAPDMATFIVECDRATFFAEGFDTMDEAQTAQVCETVFADVLDGAPLVANRSIWRQFPKLWCETWHSGRTVLLGDAAHSAHFSIGSGTRLAMEDAIALVGALRDGESLASALAAYQAARQPIAHKIVTAANTSCAWYEKFAAKMARPPLDFAFDYVTRSGRIDMDRLREQSPEFMARYDARDPVGDTDAARAIGFDKAEHANCSAILWDNLARNPDKTALIGPGGTATYSELCAAAARWGHAFRSFGLEPGERIALFLDDTPVYPAAFFGAVRAGFVPVLLNTQSNTEQVEFYLADSGARLAVCDAAFSDRFGAQAAQRTALKLTVIVNGDAPAGAFADQDGFLAGQPDTLDCAETGPDDMAFWMYSSGSTGRPKGIVHLHHDMAYTQASFGAHVLGLRPGDVCFSVPRMFFAYGFGNSMTFPFSVGATALLMPGRPDPGRILQMIETHAATVFFGLPTLYTALCRADNADRYDLSSLRQCMSAAEILSEDVFQAWKSLTGLAPIEGLGSTEMLHVYLSNTVDEQRIGAAGRAVPGYDIRLCSADGAPVEPGQDGIMQVRGTSSAPCYWNRPDKTRETMRGDWIHTGDRFVERDGYYYFQGRADDLVKVSGQWVWPLEVERCLNDHPLVHECAVVAYELPDRRMTLAAMVALREGREADGETGALLQTHVKSVLMPHKYPRRILFAAELPKTGTGKIDRQSVLNLLKA